MAHILIDKENRCTCNCATKCIVGKTGMAQRCTKEQIENEGHYTVLVTRNWFNELRISNYRQLNIFK